MKLARQALSRQASSERPVICSGCSIPSSASAVGATSARIPSPSSASAPGGDDERHRVERVRGVGRAVLLEHLVGVAVVGGDDARAALGVDRLDDPAEALVDGLDRRDRRLDHAGVADHVGVGEVDDREARSPARPSGAGTPRSPRARSSPACGRTSGRRAATAPSRAPRPSYGSSSPPLKKYVTCGYFSVSATCSCARPASAITFPIVIAGRCGGNTTGKLQSSSYCVSVV